MWYVKLEPGYKLFSYSIYDCAIAECDEMGQLSLPTGRDGSFPSIISKLEHADAARMRYM